MKREACKVGIVLNKITLWLLNPDTYGRTALEYKLAATLVVLAVIFIQGILAVGVSLTDSDGEQWFLLFATATLVFCIVFGALRPAIRWLLRMRNLTAEISVLSDQRAYLAIKHEVKNRILAVVVLLLVLLVLVSLTVTLVAIPGVESSLLGIPWTQY